jgi:hypothetical protein
MVDDGESGLSTLIPHALSELDFRHGHESGALDYVKAPVSPEIFRSKIKAEIVRLAVFITGSPNRECVPAGAGKLAARPGRKSLASTRAMWCDHAKVAAGTRSPAPWTTRMMR